MKKYLLLLLILPTVVRGQITLNATDYAGPYTGTDTLKITTTTSSYPAMFPFAGAAWDMTITTDSASDILMYRVPSSFGDYADSFYQSYGISSFYPRTSEVVALNTSNKSEIGLVIEGNSYGLAAYTATSTDTLYIPQQIATYSNPVTLLQFPAAYGSIWSSAAVLNLNFELTVGSLSLFHTPCVKRTYITRTDSVRGWGSMRVRTAAGTPSDFIDVLQVNSTQITVDSFFIDGATSHPALLIAGMTQGQRDTTYTQYYYRKGELRPLATVTHKNGLYTQPERAWIHRQKLTTAITSVLNVQAMSVFPNPVKGRLTISVPGLTGEHVCTMADLAGKTISTLNLRFAGGVATAELPAHIAPGAYLIKVVAATGIYTASVTLHP